MEKFIETYGINDVKKEASITRYYNVVDMNNEFELLNNADFIRSQISFVEGKLYLSNDPVSVKLSRKGSIYFLIKNQIARGLVRSILLEKLIKYSHRYLGFHRLSDRLALAALDSPEYYQEITNKMEADKETFYNELNALDGFNVFKSYANFILVEIEEQIKEPLKKFLTERNLIIKFMNEPVLNHHLRITLGTQEQNRLLLDAIKEFMSVYSA